MRDRVQKELEKLSPEERMEVWRATWAVLKMAPEKKKEIIGVDDQRRQQAREEFEKMIKENDLQIEDSRKREFFGRYFMGRREIEVQLGKESDERRKVLMKEFAVKLKSEFGKPAEVKKDDDK